MNPSHPRAHPLTRSLAVSVLCMALACLAPHSASAQTPTSPRPTPAVTNNTTLTLTNGTYTFAGTTNPVTAIFAGTQLGLYSLSLSSTASTSNQTVTVEFTPDGTNWLTSPTADFVYPLNGTSVGKYHTNFPVALTSGYKYARVKTIASTAIANYYVTNLWFFTR